MGSDGTLEDLAPKTAGDDDGDVGEKAPDEKSDDDGAGDDGDEGDGDEEE